MPGKGKTNACNICVSTDDGTAMPSPKEEKRAKLASVTNDLTYSSVCSGGIALI